jgi:uncharacterized protein (TIGR02145 family)
MGQAPGGINYQSIVRDVTGEVVADQAVGVQVMLLQGSISGTVVYSEAHTPMTNTYGLVTFQIGGGTVGMGDFTSIDWSMGPYYVQIGTDPTGGTDYSQIQGTSQLVSVPYALYSNASDTSRTSMIADTVKNEADGDPTNEKISGFGIVGDSLFIKEGSMDTMKVAIDTSNVNEKISMMGISGDSLSITEGGMTMKVSVDSSNVNELELPQSPSDGDMSYWDGSAWVSVSAGSEGSTLRFVGGKPSWIDYTDVLNPVTGKIWMDRNLGASTVADSLTDYNSYGDLYQWGRLSDGHETIVWTSSTTSDGSEQNRDTMMLSSMDVPGHDDFILNSGSPFDWRSPQNDNLWQGVNGVNNPCPSGYRLPTEAEWQAEIDSWISDDADGAIASPLKLPLAGYRNYSSGSLDNVGTTGGRYWSSTVSGSYARNLYFDSSNASMGTGSRAYGFTVRCLKD